MGRGGAGPRRSRHPLWPVANIIATVTDGTTSQPPRHGTFLRLLKLAFGTLVGADPVVVTTDDDTAVRLDHAWRSHPDGSAADLANTATNLLRTAPVLLIPSWGRLSGDSATAAEGPLRSVHEIAVAGVQPSGPEALLAALLPASSLSSPGGRRFREIVDQSWRPCVVIFATGIFAGVHAQFDSAAVFWRPRSSAPQPLKLFRLPRHEDEQAVENDFLDLLGRASGTGKFGYVLPDPPGAGESLSIELHDPVTTARWSELPVLGATVPLGDVFAFPGPALHRVADRHLLHERRKEGSVRVVSGRDLRQDGTVAGPDDSSRWAEGSTDRQLRAGDVLLRRMFSPHVQADLVVAEVTTNDLAPAPGGP